MDTLPVRKNIRLKEYDYSSNGLYFITICAHNRQNLFGDIVGAIHESPDNPFNILNENGFIVEKYLKEIPNRYSNLQIDCYVIMPNHIHLIIAINNERAIRESPLQPCLSKIIGYLKMNTSKHIRLLNSKTKVWQRGYYEHIIRNEKDLRETREYISNNILKWELDKYYTNN